ncbi:hypothetical protein SDC9_142970 [bioreactor metagenome]|uniref:Uncharacterized protein n=1 Tax=bioreactor metagenome TaxID=1076179 RepID=A0A645E2Q8_9ZZZZ
MVIPCAFAIPQTESPDLTVYVDVVVVEPLSVGVVTELFEPVPVFTPLPEPVVAPPPALPVAGVSYLVNP